jgi:hypothetical protein
MADRAVKIVLTVRQNGPFWFGHALIEDHDFVTNPMTTKASAQIAALGAVQAYLASSVIEKLENALLLAKADARPVTKQQASPRPRTRRRTP